MWSEALLQLDELDAAAEKVNMIRQRTSVEMPPYTLQAKRTD